MYLVRPATQDDVDALFDLLTLTAGTITTLSGDREQLARRVSRSLAAFDDPPEKPAGETYVFVMEHRDGDAHAIVGTSAVQSKTGGFEPFYGYRIEEEHYASAALGVDKLIKSLHLAEDHSGPAEVGGLFLHPDHRGGGRGRMLSLARFLFMALRPSAFDAHVVAELRGRLDANGESPFWNAVGRHFFEVPFDVADRLSFAEKQIIADLMPDHPIYIEMLPPDAGAVIGVEHVESTAARRVLEGEGFTFINLVDIFDGGPTLESKLSDIRAVRESRRVAIRIADVPEEPDLLLVKEQPRPVFVEARSAGDDALIPPDVAGATGWQSDEQGLVVRLRSN
ncbi:MAG: arginine N-succinyltransferase [Planctomycetota bacterium]